MINSVSANQKRDELNISKIKGFIFENLCHRLDKKKEVELAKMEHQHAVTLITVLLAIVFAHNLMEANSALLWVRINFLILVLCWDTIIQSAFYLLTLWQRCFIRGNPFLKSNLQQNSWLVSEADCGLWRVSQSF